MRSAKLVLGLVLAVLSILGAAAIAFAAKASGDPTPRSLPSRTTLASTEVLDNDLPQRLAPTTAVTDSILVATHSFGGSTSAVAGEGNRLYYSAGADLIIADITNPNVPAILGRWTDADKSPFYGIHVAGSLLYIPHSFAGVEIIDASIANEPVKVGNIPIRYLGTTTAIYDIEVSGAYAFVPQGKWLRVVDVTTPGLPTDIAVITPTASYLTSIAVSGDYAYIAANADGLIVVDISTPTSPTVAGTYDTPLSALGIAVQGNYVYLFDTDAVRIIDVSNPNAPVEVGAYDASAYSVGQDIAVSGSLLYLQDIYMGELHIVDVSNPSAPSQVGILSLPSSGDGLYLSGSTAYLGTASDGLAVVNVAEPSSPALLGTVGEMTYASGLVGADNGVFVASLQDLWYLRPQVSFVAATWIWDTPLYLGEISVKGELAYLAEAASVADMGQLEILDVSDPFSPVSLGAVSLTIQGASAIAVSTTYAYVGSPSGISAIDIVDPNSPHESSSISTSGNVRGMALEGSYLYAATTAGLQIYDISDPATLNFVGEYTGTSASDVAVNGQYAYLTVNSGQPRIIDVHAPSAPTLVRTLSACGVSYSVVLSNGYAYITDGCGRIALYDVSDPLSGSSSAIASADLPSKGRQVVVEDDKISVAAGSGGFVRLQQFDSVSDYLPASGGSLTSPDGNVAIYIPADTYTNTVYVRYQEEPAMDTGSLRSGGPFFTLLAYYTSTWELAPLPAGQSITITLDYPSSSVRKDTLQLYRFSSVETAWIPISSTVDMNARQVTACLTLFTGNDTFALLGESYQVYLPLIWR